MKHFKRNLKSCLPIALLFLATSTAWSQDCCLWVSEEGWQGDYLDFVANTGDIKKYIGRNSHDDGSEAEKKSLLTRKKQFLIV